MPLVLTYMLLFVAVGAGFVLVNLLIGKLVRPAKMHPEKATIYECGEPTVGSAWVQFDLRYYVVALLFVIFDVEVAFFFPWATVYGKLNALADAGLPAAARAEVSAALDPLPPPPPPNASRIERQQYEKTKEAWEKHQAKLSAGGAVAAKSQRDQALTMAWIAFVDILIFFAVLLIGYAYLWRRGDLNWVRSTAAQRMPRPPPPGPDAERQTLELAHAEA